jgi:hypothetical protein
MTHYWNLDETTLGGPFADFHATLAATCSSCPTPTPGKVRGAQLFDNNDSVNVADDGSYDWAANASFSIEFWMKKDLPCAGSANEVIMGRYDNATKFWWLGVNCDGSTPQGAILFRVRDGGITTDVSSTNAVSDGIWHHIAVVRDSSTLPNGTTRIYVDGVVQDSAIHAYATGFTSTLNLSIGYYYNISPGYHYRGVLDEVALHNSALMGAEVLDHYNRGEAGRGYCDSYLCGDANNDAAVNISDAVSLIAYIFAGGAPPNPLAAGDANCDGNVNISDAVYLIGYIFGGGPAPCATCP